MKAKPSPFALGATLYMPATHPAAMDAARGRRHPELRSMVLCLEDALPEKDVEAGLTSLRSAMRALRDAPPDPPGPLLFVRPRSLTMAREIAGWRDAGALDGIVVPKSRPGGMQGWFDALAGSGLMLMPTLETREFFDPLAVRDFRDEVTALGPDRILAMRIGGNDLLACLGLRRVRGLTLYDGPLGAVVSRLVCQFGPAGFSLTAPVCEIFDDPSTLQAELARDVAHGAVDLRHTAQRISVLHARIVL